MDNQPMGGRQGHQSFDTVERSGPACRPLDFPAPVVLRGVRVNACLVVHLQSGTRQVCSGVIHREDLSGNQEPLPSGGDSNSALSHGPPRRSSRVGPDGEGPREVLAYWPHRQLQDAIYGSVWCCLVLRRHHGVAADDAARAAGVEPGSPNAPIVWEISGDMVAIKMVEWERVFRMRGRLLEDPVKEVAAMQLLGCNHPHVLGSSEVLQDDNYLYSVMPYCRGGDLFSVVVEYAEANGGEIGMPEPVARFWFRQILSGLQHLQEQGVCHRDLSLENVLVDADNCLVIDMGMCLRVPYNDPDSLGVTDVTRGNLRRLMKPQGTCGKHNYMSPEVYENLNDFDGFAIDLWAAGVILYIMLTGFPPYDNAVRTDLRFELIVSGRLMEQLRNWEIMVSDEAGDLMQSMLQMNPRDRLTLSEVMNHPWVTNENVEPPPPQETVMFH
ncbi:activated protein kinase catalytic subunit alpha-1 [Seminavis robusta]|uniref:Activated protein kinase catalytic subunit alpha-1 n=1 Tax=Seminavis robusta TaxID=568900 RepID=A0A9N8EQN4_9STRA|nr:activated protein kinase catalytic subunit alpha-1 [Seminavis robusta]|eukprot:Sro1618_g286360.1 activated protein kinase catalytic subunit alpha-1 (441) ;mRNA; f:85-1522